MIDMDKDDDWADFIIYTLATDKLDVPIINKALKKALGSGY